MDISPYYKNNILWNKYYMDISLNNEHQKFVDNSPNYQDQFNCQTTSYAVDITYLKAEYQDESRYTFFQL